MVCAKRLIAGLLLVSSGATLARADCTGTSDAELPYSITSTKTGDGKSTTFYGLVCGLGCAEGAACAELTSVSIGGPGLGGGDGSDDCGTVYNVRLSPDGGCETFTFSSAQSGVDLESVCPDGCRVRFNLDNGERIVRTIGGGRVDPPVASPTPATPATPATANGGTVTPSATGSPKPYGGSVRRRTLNQYGGSRRLNQYSGTRKLNQY